jgi:hypothetical protein
MTMDLDRLKAMRQKEKSGDYVFEKPPNQVAADIRRKSAKMERKRFCLAVVMILFSVAGIGSFSLLYKSDQPGIANIGIILIMIGAFLEAMTCFALYFPFQANRYELSRTAFLARERTMILARIRAWKRNTGFNVLPLALGAFLWAVTRTDSLGQTVAAISMIALTVLVSAWMGRRRIDRDLRPALDEIDRELEELALTLV